VKHGGLAEIITSGSCPGIRIDGLARDRKERESGLVPFNRHDRLPVKPKRNKEEEFRTAWLETVERNQRIEPKAKQWLRRAAIG